MVNMVYYAYTYNINYQNAHIAPLKLLKWQIKGFGSKFGLDWISKLTDFILDDYSLATWINLTLMHLDQTCHISSNL